MTPVAGTGWFPRMLRRHPLAAQCAMAGALWCAGDVLSQSVSKARAPSDPVLDWRRVAVMATYGFCIAGPLYTGWYRLLDRTVEPVVKRVLTSAGHTAISKHRMVWSVTLAKVAADNFVFEPPYLSLFFLSTHVMSGASVADAVRHLRADFAPTYVTDVSVWTPIQLVNFRFVPVHFQPLFVNVFNVGWNAFLSFVKHEGSHFVESPRAQQLEAA
ncbi:hypothetical protein HDU83_003374 [Entophlyctis luteolus]|nr:hypothetical protein HDU82_009022 [Entophlyctis luteolus]KAJ3346107.1 hypothetical protein HDU83_003374 [Entophlyctis luteolus]KAJ3384188.1 hypothetical protein HDU84_003092 [Entophlyctis sp. JEL0112]